VCAAPAEECTQLAVPVGVLLCFAFICRNFELLYLLCRNFGLKHVIWVGDVRSLKAGAELKHSLIPLLVVRLQQAVVGIGAGQKTALHSCLTSLHSANPVLVVVARAKTMSVIGKWVGTVVNPAAWAANGYSVDHDDMQLLCKENGVS
jgi:hypothetical protein